MTKKYTLSISIILIISLFVVSGCKKQAQPILQPPTKAQSMYYVAVDKNSPSFDKLLVPAGSLIDSCGNYLTLRMGGEYEYLTKENHLTHVFDDLVAFSNEGVYINPLRIAGIALVGVANKEGEVVVTLSGSLPKTDDPCADAVPRLQLEKTIEQNIGSEGYRVVWQ